MIVIVTVVIHHCVCTCPGPARDVFRFAVGLLAAALGLLGKPLLYMVLRSGLVALSASGTALKGLEGWTTGLACLVWGWGWGCIDPWLPAHTIHCSNNDVDMTACAVEWS